MTTDNETRDFTAAGERELRRAEGELLFATRRIEMLNLQLASIRGSRAAQLAGIVSRTTQRALPEGTERRRLVSAAVRSASAARSGDLTGAIRSWRRDAGPRLGAVDTRWNRFCARHEPDAARLRSMREQSRAWRDTPVVSILLPTYEPKAEFLRAAIESVIAQAYERWELCIVDDGSPARVAADVVAGYRGDDRVRFSALDVNGGIAASSQAAASMATGDWIALLDHDDVLRPHALFEIVDHLRANPDCDFVYSDEDKLDAWGRHIAPYLKPDWSPELLESCNYISHLTVIHKALFDRAGGFRRGFDGSQDYDLFLRCSELAAQIGHVREALYSWRMHEGSAAGDEDAKPHAYAAAVRSLEERLERSGTEGVVSDGAWKGLYRVHRAVTGTPRIAAILPARNGVDRLRTSLACLERQAADHDIRIVIVDMGCEDPATREYLAQCGYRVVAPDGTAPSAARMINLGVEAAGPADHVLLFSQHIVLGRGDWLEPLVEHSQVPGVGAVGARLVDDAGGATRDGVRVGSRGLPREDIDLSEYFGMALATRTVTAVSGDCLLAKASLWGQLGGLDEEYADYGDLDLCMRLVHAGYRNVQQPDAELFIRRRDDPPAVRSVDDARVFTSRWGPFPQGYDRYAGGHIWSYSPIDFR